MNKHDGYKLMADICQNHNIYDEIMTEISIGIVQDNNLYRSSKNDKSFRKWAQELLMNDQV